MSIKLNLATRDDDTIALLAWIIFGNFHTCYIMRGRLRVVDPLSLSDIHCFMAERLPKFRSAKAFSGTTSLSR